MGIAFLGLFTTALPSPTALASAEQLLAWRFRIRGLDPLGQAAINNRTLFRIAGHCDTGSNTICPGDPLLNNLPTMRSNVALRMRQVISPNGGEMWPVGTAQTISWDFAAVGGDVRVDLSVNGGSF